MQRTLGSNAYTCEHSCENNNEYKPRLAPTSNAKPCARLLAQANCSGSSWLSGIRSPLPGDDPAPAIHHLPRKGPRRKGTGVPVGTTLATARAQPLDIEAQDTSTASTAIDFGATALAQNPGPQPRSITRMSGLQLRSEKVVDQLGLAEAFSAGRSLVAET